MRRLYADSTGAAGYMTSENILFYSSIKNHLYLSYFHLKFVDIINERGPLKSGNHSEYLAVPGRMGGVGESPIHYAMGILE